ncbi:hypothetical protein EC968_009785 [Mortierella alpina]|nr:hypothetical protein EC968_009785 [Mortierella alpina]
MDTSTEQQLSHALLERLEPLIHTAECQLRDLGQGQVLLHSSIAELSSTLNLTQEQLDNVQDTFAKLPLYIAKLNAMKNTIASVTVQSRKLKRRADQVAAGREKQAVKSQAARAKEQAYDQTIAAVPVANASPVATPSQHIEGSSLSLRSSSSSPSPTLASSNRTRPGTPTRSGSPSTSSLYGTPTSTTAASAIASDGTSSQSLKSHSSGSISSIRLPFPLPAKPAFPIISSTRPLSGSGSPPPSLTPRRMSPTLAASPGGVAIGNDSAMDAAEATRPPRELVDRFPQVSLSSQDDSGIAAVSPSAVEVVRLRRKKKAVSKSSASSVASISTTASAPKDKS